VPGTATEVLPAPEPTPAAPPATELNSSPLPAPRVVPQETRSQPLSSTPRVMAASGDAESVSDQPPAIVRSRRSSAVVPAGYWSEAAGDGGNPLRSGSQRPIGSGVAEQ
jgi:hypothetical protein